MKQGTVVTVRSLHACSQLLCLDLRLHGGFRCRGEDDGESECGEAGGAAGFLAFASRRLEEQPPQPARILRAAWAAAEPVR